MNDLSLTIIGVMPKSFDGILIDSGEDITIPFGATRDHFFLDRRRLGLYAYGRLKPGVSFEAARAEFRTLWPAIQAASEPEGYVGPARARYYARKAEMESASTGQANLRVRLSKPLTILMGLAGVVLLIACVNLANLMLSRGWVPTRTGGTSSSGSARPQAHYAIDDREPAFNPGLLRGIRLPGRDMDQPVTDLYDVDRRSPSGFGRSSRLACPSLHRICGACYGCLAGLAPAWRISRTDPADALRQNTRSVRGASFRPGFW